MLDLGGALVDAVRARLAASPGFGPMVLAQGLEGAGVPRLCFATPDMQGRGQGPIGQIEIALTVDSFAKDRQAAFAIGRAAMAATSPMKYRLRASRSVAVVVLHWRGDYHGQEADDEGLWQYSQRFMARGIAG